MTKGKKNKIVTKIWVTDGNFVLRYFEEKAKQEVLLGRVMTTKEANDLMEAMSKKEDIDGITIDNTPENVKAVLTEHFNVYDPVKEAKKKRKRDK